MGLSQKISIEYGDQQVLPTAAACFCILRLPVLAAESKATFFEKMDVGVLDSKNHFGIL